MNNGEELVVVACSIVGFLIFALIFDRNNNSRHYDVESNATSDLSDTSDNEIDV